MPLLPISMTTAAYDYRIANELDFANFPALARLKIFNYIPYIFDLEVNMEAPDAEAEIASGFTHRLDGTTTAVKLDIVSASADDAAAGTGARTVGIFGISATAAAGTFSYFEETVTLAGATPVTTARYYKRVITMRVLTAGSGGVAAGAITLSETGGTTNTYATIAISTITAVSTRFYAMTGKFVSVGAFELSYSAGTAAKNATARISFSDSVLTDAAAGNNTVINSGTPFKGFYLNKVLTGDNTKYITVFHDSIDSDNNVTVSYHIVYFIW